jgi:5-epi-alpha-selinene synthase
MNSGQIRIPGTPWGAVQKADNVVCEVSFMNLVMTSELYCPFESGVNPHLKQVQESALRWMQDIRLAKDERTYDRARHERHAALVAYMMPKMPLVDLRLAADAMTWFFAHDDYVDSAFQGRDADFQDMQRQLWDACNGNASEKPAEPLSRGLHDICWRLAARSGAGWSHRFRRDVEEYLEAIAWERDLRTASMVPDVTTYMLLRPIAGTVHMFFSLMAALNDIPSNATFLQHLCVRKLADLAGLQMTFYNDIWSFQRDLSEGHSFNLISVLQKENCLSLEAAVNLAVSLTNKQVTAFLRLRDMLPHFGLAEDALTQKYVAALQDLMSGHRNWMMQTPRFDMDRSVNCKEVSR